MIKIIPLTGIIPKWMLTKPPPMTAIFFLGISEESITAEGFGTVLVAPVIENTVTPRRFSPVFILVEALPLCEPASVFEQG